ncbi:hypothetical protein D3C81_1527230 [compost metagenome]
MSDAFVAINTGLFFRNPHFVHFLRIGALCSKIHRIHAVATATSRRVAGFQLRPHGLRHFQAMFFKLFWGINFLSNELMINIFCCPEFGNQEIKSSLWNMTIRTFSANTFLILKMDRTGIFLIRCLHRMA